ncbi:hypothetical protein AXX12_08160 [Anaerosporomusa subterranea]|uniref:Uncharacterized protein n=1 Tax=Anaerosporomusa subterranea TaxID=1794912 RepID=A0A154BSA8_ANASB|nr:hypothetical protein AXX12_08160 [Anaerosporomusa subterranea]
MEIHPFFPWQIFAYGLESPSWYIMEFVKILFRFFIGRKNAKGASRLRKGFWPQAHNVRYI